MLIRLLFGLWLISIPMALGCGDRGAGAVCGDGVREGDEQCDGTDLGGESCDAIVSGAIGALGCGGDCRLDLTRCAWCGNGVREGDERCDCGTDPERLPPGCVGVNGAADSGCSAECWRGACGDGVWDPGEECDCGTDGNNLPPGCEDINGGANGHCDAECLIWGETWTEPWEECDPRILAPCSGDDWGVEPGCVTWPSRVSRCARTCVDWSDCYGSSRCIDPTGSAYCEPAPCADATALPALRAPCETPSGVPGWCLPFGDYGFESSTPPSLCVEQGPLLPGATCEAPVNPYLEPLRFIAVDRSVPTCAGGFCRGEPYDATGICHAFCNWEIAYATHIYDATPLPGHEPCPSGGSCVSGDTLDPSGAWVPGLTFCVDASEDVACSLITGELLLASGGTCADVVSQGRCVAIGSAPIDQQATLVGHCEPGASAIHTVWDACDPGSDPFDCPEGTRCVREDFFAAAPTGTHRCVPVCDTEHHDGVQATCQDRGAGVDAICTAAARLLTATPTGRLGLCALPPP